MNLTYLRAMTTPLGLVQHAIGHRPDLAHGYSIDDNARALIACVWYAQLIGPTDVADLAPIYLRHLLSAQLPDGRFHNFRDQAGTFIDVVGSEDSLGRTIWALGTALAEWPDARSDSIRSAFQAALQPLLAVHFPRAMAFALAGLAAAQEQQLASQLTERLLQLYQKQAQPDWPWFEPMLTYSNAIFPYSLLQTTNRAAERVALDNLSFLNRVCRIDGQPAPIGNDGWYQRGKRARFDQQAVDTADMVLANLAAFERTRDQRYWREANDWFGWFSGHNVHTINLITSDGGCFDGLTPTGFNHNQGAESVVVYLLSQLALMRVGRLVPPYSGTSSS